MKTNITCGGLILLCFHAAYPFALQLVGSGMDYFQNPAHAVTSPTQKYCGYTKHIVTGRRYSVSRIVQIEVNLSPCLIKQ
jgi:hypothetical protein